jgi:hypothetical protein
LGAGVVLFPSAGAVLMALSTVIIAINGRFLHVEHEAGQVSLPPM